MTDGCYQLGGSMSEGKSVSEREYYPAVFHQDGGTMISFTAPRISKPSEGWIRKADYDALRAELDALEREKNGAIAAARTALACKDAAQEVARDAEQRTLAAEAKLAGGVQAEQTKAVPQEKIGHDEAREKIETHIKEIEIICDVFGYDPCEWLNYDDSRVDIQQDNIAGTAPAPVAAGVVRKAEHLIDDEGVFLGHEGLRGLAECDEFWEKQDYGTRLYYGDGTMDYLHRSVLRAAIAAMDKAAALLQAREGDARDAERYRWLRSRAYGQRDQLAPNGQDFVLEPPKVLRGQNILKGSLAEHLDSAIDAALRNGGKS